MVRIWGRGPLAELARAGSLLKEGLRVSSFACLSGFVVLILDLQAGACFQAHQRGADAGFIDTEHQGLLLAVVVLVTDAEEVLAFLAEKE